MRTFFRKVKRLIDFVPIIWRGYDFDHYYAEELFFYQLQRISNFLKSEKAHTLNSKIHARKIDTAIELWKKISDEKYGCEYQEKVKEKFGENTLNFVFEKDEEAGPDLFRMGFEYENWDNAEEIQEFNDQEFFKSQKKQERAHKLLWTYVEHHIRSWWD